MTKAPPLDIYPPLLNTPCPWASTRADLLALWECTSTGAITTRTSLPDGFAHDDTVHQHTFFDAADSRRHGPRDDENDMHGSLNTFGYSPYTLSYYIDAIKSLPGFGSSINSKKENRERKNNDGNGNSKWVIVSVTGTPNDVVRSYSMLCDLAAEFPRAPRVAMEVNLSCPNIFGAPPPAYTEEGLVAYLGALRCVAVGNDGEDSIIDGAIRPRPPRLPIGIKTPPYTYVGQFEAFVRGLSREESAGVVDFVVATNTLGGCLVLGSNGVEQEGPVLPGEGIGGMAGTPLHPLSLGNVKTLREKLDSAGLGHIKLIGVGGVDGAAAYKRMRAVGADAVGVATALGRMGPKVFDEISVGVGGKW